MTITSAATCRRGLGPRCAPIASVVSQKYITKVVQDILVELSSLNNTMSMVSGVSVQVSAFLAAGFSLLAAGRNSEQIERRTSNVPILMALRFIDFKTSEPQPATSSVESNFEE